MPNYNEMFKLSLNEIDLIEHAVRDQIGNLSQMNASHPITEEEKSYQKIRKLMDLLGTIHNQKVYYCQVHHRSGMPLG